ncbi:COX15/CtaA family protein [Propioniciclava soli]|uniref:COX15/CtaA family protein n=1 Tax=Propioniciclava soli TaxID=2775081 RepID=A0ABZ3C488_9ACTN
MDVTRSRALKGWSIASLIANMVIIWTGALVRLTGSGLGCPTWPQCEPGSYVPTPEMGIHGAIEFGNRLLTFVLAAIALVTFVLALRAFRRGAVGRSMPVTAFAVGLGIIAQAIIGGISVRMQLNPWIVGLHMFVSVFLILACVWLVHHAYASAPAFAPLRLARLTEVVFALGIVVIALGVVTTGAGPHAGDGGAARNALSTEWTAKIHAWSVWALVALTVLGVVWAWSDARLRRLWLILLGAELLQGLIGYVQYFTHLPLGVVLAHMVGTTVFTAALGHVWLLTRRTPSPAPAGAEPDVAARPRVGV